MKEKRRKPARAVAQKSASDLLRKDFPIGARVHGKVLNFTNDRAFIEVEDNVAGWVHVSDLSWTRLISHPSEILKVGDEVDAIILDVVRRSIRLGLKQVSAEPYSSLAPPEGSPAPEIEWLRGIMAEAPGLFENDDFGGTIRAYALPGAAEDLPENPSPGLLTEKLSDVAVNGNGLRQQVSEYVKRLLARTDVSRETRASLPECADSVAIDLQPRVAELARQLRWAKKNAHGRGRTRRMARKTLASLRHELWLTAR